MAWDSSKSQGTFFSPSEAAASLIRPKRDSPHVGQVSIFLLGPVYAMHIFGHLSCTTDTMPCDPVTLRFTWSNDRTRMSGYRWRKAALTEVYVSSCAS